MSRVVLDTTIVISGFLWQGAPYRILKAASLGKLSGFSSMPLLAELEKTLLKPKFAPYLLSTEHTPASLVAIYESFIDIVIPEQVKETIVIADPSDDVVITTALAAGAEFIVTGNRHLLELDNSFSLQIISPSVFARTL